VSIKSGTLHSAAFEANTARLLATALNQAGRHTGTGEAFDTTTAGNLRHHHIPTHDCPPQASWPHARPPTELAYQSDDPLLDQHRLLPAQHGPPTAVAESFFATYKRNSSTPARGAASPRSNSTHSCGTIGWS
jgi:hypothetical protein